MSKHEQDESRWQRQESTLRQETEVALSALRKQLDESLAKAKLLEEKRGRAKAKKTKLKEQLQAFR